ncbi:YeiH family protein [Alistipes sp.]|uniref:YeiH family protein n=1 Tax=Alistipes sp. TaxID=1872444 RepID=UPI003A8B6418
MLEKGNRANTLHGILLIALFSFAAFYIAGFPVIKRLSFSPLIVGIVLGMLYANSLRNKLPETWVPGIKFCTKQVLRWGIILYGFRLTLAQVAAVGVPAVVVDLVVVTVTILGGVLLGRLLKIDRDTALMTSTGSAICGAAAVLGAEPVVRCEGYKTAIAVSTVVIFGTLSMFLYPIMYRTGLLDGLSDTGVAIYTGSTLHEVAHVAGAGNAMDPTDSLGIAGTATITKMIRVMMLAPVLVVMSFALAGRRRREAAAAVAPGTKAEKSRITIPWFAFGFIAVICLNSLLQHWCGVESVREIPLNGTIEYIDTFLLTMAMTALGTETSLDKFRQAGAKPFVLAGLLYVWLVVGGYFLTKWVVGIC